MARTSEIRRLLALALGLAFGCTGAAPGPGDLEIAQRLVPVDAAGFFERTDLLEAEPIETWSFTEPEDLGHWQQLRFDRQFELRDRHLRLQSSRTSPRLVREVEWQAESVDALELQVAGFSRGTARLYWSGTGEALSQKASLIARQLSTKGPQSLVFDLAFHPSWLGTIRRLEIEFGSASNEVIRLHRIRLLRYRPAADRLAAAIERPWKVELDHDVRNGILALPGMVLERRVSVPPGAAALRCGFGLDPAARRPVLFSVSLDVEGRDKELLFETSVDPGEPQQAGRWHDREVDLESFSGGVASLILETHAAGQDDASLRDLAFWANPEVLQRRAGPRRPNVVVISIDTLRADHLSLYGYPRPTSPFLDRWAGRRAVVFENAVATSPWTIPSHVSIFTGVDALRHGVNHKGSAPAAFRLMAEYFREAGYATLAVTGGGFMHPREGFAQGFDRYRYWPEAKSESEIENGIDRALEWIESSRDRPFFLFFHTYEVHYPFRQREPFFSRFGGKESGMTPELHLGYASAPRVREDGFLLAKQFLWRASAGRGARAPLADDEFQQVVDWYDSGIGYADSQLARLLSRLEELFPDERPVVVVTSDHGEALGEKGLAGHAYLYDFNLLVPLVIASPEIGRGGARVETQVRTVDILPTVLELAGLEPPADVDGISLVPMLEGREAPHPREAWSYAAFSNRGLSLRVDNRLKYLFNNTATAPPGSREELYDLRRDPREEFNLAVGARGVAELRQTMLRRNEETGSALEVRFVNISDQAYRGWLRGQAIHLAMVKSFDLPASALVRQDHGAMEFQVRPGDDFKLFLERASPGRLTVEAAFVGIGETLKASLDPAVLEGGWRLIPEGAGPLGTAAQEPGRATGIFIHWPRGVPRDAAPDPAAVDPERLARLRALGYTE